MLPGIWGEGMKLEYPTRDRETVRAAADILEIVPAVDLHSHLGCFYFDDGYPDRALANMRTGNVAACVAATIGDKPAIERTERGLRAVREVEPGLLYSASIKGFETLNRAVEDGGAVLAKNAADVRHAKAQGKPAVISGIEGGDYLEGELGGVEAAYDLGVRLFQLVHYRINELGDIQTEEPHHGGLTDFGADVVRESDRLGMVIDLAHAPFSVCRDTIKVAKGPVVVSHTVLGDVHPRCINAEHAQMVADTGGMIGVWPSKLAVRDFAEFIDGIFALAELIGPDHVGIGTDMDAVKNPVYTGYDEFHVIPEALLAGGMAADDIGKIVGGNFMRVFDEVAG
jgi:membrane dipeptidase